MGLVFHHVLPDPRAAERYYLSALRIAPNHPGVLANLAELLRVRVLCVPAGQILRQPLPCALLDRTLCDC